MVLLGFPPCPKRPSSFCFRSESAPAGSERDPAQHHRDTSHPGVTSHYAVVQGVQIKRVGWWLHPGCLLFPRRKSVSRIIQSAGSTPASGQPQSPHREDPSEGLPQCMGSGWPGSERAAPWARECLGVGFPGGSCQGTCWGNVPIGHGEGRAEEGREEGGGRARAGNGASGKGWRGRRGAGKHKGAGKGWMALASIHIQTPPFLSGGHRAAFPCPEHGKRMDFPKETQPVLCKLPDLPAWDAGKS